MNIVVSFKDKTISVDGFSCYCEQIAKLGEDWISLEVSDAYGVTLYRVGHIDTLEDTSFMTPWIEHVLAEQQGVSDLLAQQEKDHAQYLVEVAKAEQVEAERLAALEAERLVQDDLSSLGTDG